MTEIKLPARVKHFANIGDLIASLAGLKKYYERTGRKIIFSQQINVPGEYFGQLHPTRDDSDPSVMVMCNRKMYDMVRPLVIAQDYIDDMDIFTGQPIAFDLDRIRKEVFVNIPHQAIQQWIFLAFPDLAADLSKPWVEVGEVDVSDCALFFPDLVTGNLDIENIHDKVILNFTERYRNPHLNYYLLREFEDRLIFAGTDREYLDFCQKWSLMIPRLIVKDFLQLAYIIKHSKFLMSNQSFCWNVAEAMKTPRLLELCESAPNCQAFIGEHSYGYLHQKGIPFYFKELLNRK